MNAWRRPNPRPGPWYQQERKDRLHAVLVILAMLALYILAALIDPQGG